MRNSDWREDSRNMARTATTVGLLALSLLAAAVTGVGYLALKFI
jgi:hypothetical protein